MFERSLKQAGVRLEIIKFSSVTGMRACAAKGIGFTVCPAVSVEKELAEKSLVRLNWAQKDLEISIIMIWHAEKWCSPLLKYFMRTAETVISGEPA